MGEGRLEFELLPPVDEVPELLLVEETSAPPRSTPIAPVLRDGRGTHMRARQLIKRERGNSPLVLVEPTLPTKG